MLLEPPAPLIGEGPVVNNSLVVLTTEKPNQIIKELIKLKELDN